jgi:hypothetical protein
MIVQASAGLDASKTFDDLAHTSNPEVMSLLSKYFLGHLATKPDFRSTSISSLYDLWYVIAFFCHVIGQPLTIFDRYQYLRNVTESLTTLFFEVDMIMDPKSWVQGDLLNIARVRKFYQFQSRLLQASFSTLFGAKLQELHLQLSYALVSSAAPNRRVPDVVGIITRAQASSASAATANEISQLGQFVCNGHGAQLQENGILKYAQKVTELDIQFLEEVRHDVCEGMDAFDLLKSTEIASMSDKQQLVQFCAYLLSVLERVAHRLETFFTRLAKESIYQPQLEKNPAKTRWNVLRRKIRDGSFFSLARESSFDGGALPFRSGKNDGKDIMFYDVISQAKRRLEMQPAKTQTGAKDLASAPKRLAEAHTARADADAKASSSHERHVSRKALKSMAIFMDENDQSIKRLSQLPAHLNFEQLVETYGKQQNRTEKRPPVPAKEQQPTSKAALHHRYGSQNSVSSGHSSGASPLDYSPARKESLLARRPTNRSISSGVGLPSKPTPRAQFSTYPSTPEDTAGVTGMPLPLKLNNPSRSSSRTRTAVTQSGSREQSVPNSRTPIHSLSQRSYDSRQTSTPSPHHRLLSNNPQSDASGSISGATKKTGPALLQSTQPSHVLNSQLLAQMQRENEVILRANGKGLGENVGPGPAVEERRGRGRMVRV